MSELPLSIPPDLLARCFAHGGETYPVEGCGVLSGPTGSQVVDGYHPIANVLDKMHTDDPERYPRTAANGYFMDPVALMHLEKELAGQGRAVKVVFHSHVDVGAYFSEEDKTRALWAGQPLLPGVVYLVCGIKERQPDGAILAWFDEAARDFTTAPLEG